jgi:hypothetical protein
MILALVLQTITLASGDYDAVLITAIALTVAADSCFLAAFIRGRLAARFASVVLMLPTMFVVADFLRTSSLLMDLTFAGALAGCGNGNEYRAREAVLQPLLATNAPLSEVVARAGHFTVTRRGTPEYTQMIAQYKAGSRWDRHIARKAERAFAAGHTSTISMQTWIFLDEQDRLIDFELGSQ